MSVKNYDEKKPGLLFRPMLSVPFRNVGDVRGLDVGLRGLNPRTPCT